MLPTIYEDAPLSFDRDTVSGFIKIDIPMLDAETDIEDNFVWKAIATTLFMVALIAGISYLATL